MNTSPWALVRAVREDATGITSLEDREPFRYRPRSDNAMHVVVAGDTLDSIADQFYGRLPEAAQLGWIIADFQPEPILDKTAVLSPGVVLVVPSVDFVNAVLGANAPAAARLV